MTHRFAICLSLLIAVVSLSGGMRAESAKFPGLADNGAFVLGDRAFSLAHFDASWARADQSSLTLAPGYPREENGIWITRGHITVAGGGRLLLSQTVRSDGPGAFVARYEVEVPATVRTEALCVTTSLPVETTAGREIVADGAHTRLPAWFGETVLYSGAGKSVTLPSSNGALIVSGGEHLFVQDDRRWGGETYLVRIPLQIREDDGLRAVIELRFEEKPYASRPLSIATQANRSWSDPVAADGLGGWTDQGPDNDLRSLPAGKMRIHGVAFDVIDEKTNADRACLVLTGRDPAADGFRREAVVSADGEAPRALYLLHASAWLPAGDGEVGVVEAVADDGSVERFPILANRDVGDWWAPSPLARGAVGWTGENRSSKIGLYVTRLDMSGKPLRELRFKGSGHALWMIAALSVSDDRIDLPLNIPVTLRAGAGWSPYSHRLDIERGGVFDFSFLNETPAGAQGFVKVSPAGRFEFEKRPGAPVRFWGVNLCFEANFPDHALAERLADRLARSGYNIVRLHHFDGGLVRQGGRSYEFDPVRLDRLDRLVAALKARGIYVSIDLYSLRRFSRDEIPDLGRDFGVEIKQLVQVSDGAFESWRRFAENLLRHVNPYTGLALADDPVLAGVCPVNEDSHLELPRGDDALARLYRDAFERWREKQPAGIAADRPAADLRFLTELQIRTDDRFRAALRDLGVRAPITGTNYHELQMLTLTRERYDYVDTHMYWDHPLFAGRQWKLPFKFNQTSAVRYESALPRILMPTRVLGRPFTVTEFNFVMPNAYRAEGALLAPAYASLQDWDGMFNFDYSSSDVRLDTIGVGGVFDIATDPIGMLADRFGALVFRRGDVKPATTTIGFVPSEKRMFGLTGTRPRDFPKEFSRLGLVARIGALPTDESARPPVNARVWDDAGVLGRTAGARDYFADDTLVGRLVRDGVLPEGSLADRPAGAIVSETGELVLTPDKGVFAMSTPSSAGFVLPPDESVVGDFLSVRNGSVFGVVCVAAVDGRPLKESSRLLLLHLSDALNSGMKFDDVNHRLLTDLGGMPHLARKAKATAELALPEGDWRVWSVRSDGSRVREVPLGTKDGRRVLALETVPASGDGEGFAYELIRSAPSGS